MIYTYEIINVDEAARSMEVVYTHATHGKIHVGTRLPFAGEPLESVIREFAPVGYWAAMEIPVTVPQVGTSGTVDVAPDPTPTALEENEVPL